MGKGIDQLKLHSVQPGYLKILQMVDGETKIVSPKNINSPRPSRCDYCPVWPPCCRSI
ncbi:hypothetical protein F511_07188 [Dorcoceras hygrometricum]|uniref:Uncharacterized protein n=1 Tax=Dorcoceras hygrometricum TaxID=472368 RepID=A0A2Z7APD9_9LAMI|nr:hypothetical protein F511_07188 [Dorcoceras hygrometricum]